MNLDITYLRSEIISLNEYDFQDIINCKFATFQYIYRFFTGDDMICSNHYIYFDKNTYNLIRFYNELHFQEIYEDIYTNFLHCYLVLIIKICKTSLNFNLFF